MDIPASTPTNTSPFSVQAARDLLTALQTQEESRGNSVDFNQVLESTRLITDTLEVGTVGQTATADPTSSLLFQAHSGALEASQALTAPFESALALDQGSRLMVTGISSSAAAGPFANGQTSRFEDFRTGLNGLNPAASSQYPAVAGAADFTSTYDSLRSAGRMNPPIGTSVDLKG